MKYVSKENGQKPRSKGDGCLRILGWSVASVLVLYLGSCVWIASKVTSAINSPDSARPRPQSKAVFTGAELREMRASSQKLSQRDLDLMQHHDTDALHMMHCSRDAVTTVLDIPFEVGKDEVDHRGVICQYHFHGDSYVIEFEDDKAVSIEINFGTHFDSAREALAHVGIDMAGRKPTETSQLHKEWIGTLFPFVSKIDVTGSGNDWDGVLVYSDVNS